MRLEPLLKRLQNQSPGQLLEEIGYVHDTLRSIYNKSNIQI